VAVFRLRTPLSEGDVRRLRAGDTLYLTGTMVTARDAAHRRALEFIRAGRRLPVDLEGLAIFHCGPLVRREEGGWRVLAAGPTTSARMEPFTAELIGALGVRVVIGKGGMGAGTTEAMRRFGAVYGTFTGGAAVLAAGAVRAVRGVEWLDLGAPEALWVLEVERFGPLVVAIDSHGRNLHLEVRERAEKSREAIYRGWT